MAARPPTHPPVVAVDDDDDGFDWEAAVRQIDDACALASSSAAASTSAPLPEPSATAPFNGPSSVGGARQSTLDRFVNSWTKRQMAKDMPPPAPVVPAAAPTGGGGRFAARADEGCSRRADEEEVAEGSCTVAVDPEAVQTWVYPTNIEVREYQQYIVQKALFTNTLVALPTGLGKTFIAAVVMYNYFRWFPEGKIVFTAPSRPLVTQQIEACHNTVGIPQNWTIDMKGNVNPEKRAILWKSKRVFFVTPQILENDIQTGICMVKQLVCLVIDEAHRASGNHSYCIAVREMVASRVPLRILALTATPGSKHPDIQGVIKNLCISELVHLDESDPEVSRYVNTRTVELVKVPVGNDGIQVNNMLLDIVRPHLAQLRSAGLIDNRDAANWTQHQLLLLMERYKEAPPPNIPPGKKEVIYRSFQAAMELYRISKMLLSHGVKTAYQSMETNINEGKWNFLSRSESFMQAKMMMQDILDQGVPSPKVQKLVEVLLDHFNKNNPKDSRVIIFSHFRESVKEILSSIEKHCGQLVRPAAFIGQSSAGDRLKGQTQKTQQAILQKFRSGELNILVATSIGEEGLDIMEVDLVICFDANVSPLRMIQRMGRTGRKHAGRVVVLACEGQELKGYEKKKGSTRNMKKLLRNRDNFEYHASPRMVPHVHKPEVKYVKLSIEKYIRCSKKIKVDVSSASPSLKKISEEDGQLIARYFSTCKEDIWKPSLVAFPRFQVSPCGIYRVPHSFRTTAMLIDSMQQLQDLSFSRTKRGSPLQEPADVAAVEDQAVEETSPAEVVWSKSVCVPSSPVKKYPVHCFFSGDYAALDVKGYVSITFVPALPKTSGSRKGTGNVNFQHKVQDRTAYILTVGVSRPAADGNYSSKPICADNVLNLAAHAPEYLEQCNTAGDNHLILPETPAFKTCPSPREKWDTPLNAKLESPSLSVQGDMELSPRLTHYIEEGIVPESPVIEVSNTQSEIGNAANVDFVPKVGSSKPHFQGAQANGLPCHNRSLSFEKKGLLTRINEHPGASRDTIEDQFGSKKTIEDQTQANTEEPMCPTNVKMCSPAHTPTANLLCDSLSDDWQSKSVGDKSGSVQQAPKLRRLCKYGDKIKGVPSMSLNNRYDGLVGGQCDLANKSMPNQMEHTMGNKGKAKRRLDIYIDEEVQVSEDADISADEDDNQSEDKYEDSFIDDQTTPTGQFTQSGQGGENTGDMMAIYRQSLFTQSPVVLPSRFQDVSDNFVSRAGSASCSSGNLPNSIGTPEEILQTRRTIGPSPLCHQQCSLKRASSIKEVGETSIVNCESSTKTDSRKRKLSFQQAASTSIPVINLEPEPAPQPSSHLSTELNNDMYWDDDAFFENLDLDAIEAQATEQLRQQKSQSAQKPAAEATRASDVSFEPPSFDLGF